MFTALEPQDLPGGCAPQLVRAASGADAYARWSAEAATLGERIRASAVDDGGRTGWRDPAVPLTASSKPPLLGPHLYAGTTGIALFLAALERATGSGESGDLALRTLGPLRRQLAHLAADPATAARFQFKLGGVIGLGCYVYAFLRIGRWLERPDLLRTAADAASLITPARIAADPALDVMHGCAGALLALLRFESEAPEELVKRVQPLARARACGERLLAARTAHDGGPRAWPAGGYRPWCGFAHGAAGIALALARLAGRTGREDFQEAALEGLAFERLHFDAERGNWRDLRTAEGRFMTAWCHGAPGVALGRLGMRDGAADPAIERELRIALATTRDHVLIDRDFMCCGNMGRADVLLQASRALADGELAAAAERLADRVVTAAAGRGTYSWSSPDEVFTPAFFTGAAGIGYALLRLTDPTLPCVLGLE